MLLLLLWFSRIAEAVKLDSTTKKRGNYTFRIILCWYAAVFSPILGVSSPPERHRLSGSLPQSVFLRRLNSATAQKFFFFWSTKCNASSGKLKFASSVLKSSTWSFSSLNDCIAEINEFRQKFGCQRVGFKHWCKISAGKTEVWPPVNPSCKAPDRSFFPLNIKIQKSMNNSHIWVWRVRFKSYALQKRYWRTNAAFPPVQSCTDTWIGPVWNA